MKNDKRPQEPEQTPNTPSRNRAFTIMMIKVVLGGVFIVSCADEISGEISVFLVGLVIGLGLIVWGIIPYLDYRRKEKNAEIERVLSTPISKLEEEDEAERLARKYYDKDRH